MNDRNSSKNGDGSRDIQAEDLLPVAQTRNTNTLLRGMPQVPSFGSRPGVTRPNMSARRRLGESSSPHATIHRLRQYQQAGQ